VTAVAELSHASKHFGRHVALDDVSVSFHAGQIAGIVGPNGAGKTTMLRIAADLLRPSSGHVRGPAPAGMRYFGGDQTLPPDVSARSWARLWIGPAANAIPARKFAVLSRGTRQRVGLEVTLAHPETELLLLDEPWEGLDPDASRWLSDQLIRKRATGAAVVVSSHRIHDLASICDRCEFLARGCLAHGVVCAIDSPLDVRVATLLDGFDRARDGACSRVGADR
jgi:ABC-type multidrug transport system ATPase subunit